MAGNARLITPEQFEVHRALGVLRERLLRALDQGAQIDMELDSMPVSPGDVIDGLVGKTLWRCVIEVREPLADLSAP